MSEEIGEACSPSALDAPVAVTSGGLERWEDTERCGSCGLIPAEHWGCCLDACVVSEIRQAAKRVTGGNMTFADDDVSVLEFLAATAVKAGLTQGLHPSVAKTAGEAIKTHPMFAEATTGTATGAEPVAAATSGASHSLLNPNGETK